MVALANPALLRWARDSARLDEATAAKRIRVSEDSLRSWESGSRNPTIAQLRDAARVYRRPLAAFYLREPPPEFPPLRDFRVLPRQVSAHYSPELAYLVRRVREQQQWLIEIQEELDAPHVGLVGSATPDEGATAIAQRTRRLLGITVDDQRSWRRRDEAFRQWRHACERQGAFVLQSRPADGVDINEMRGFALSHRLAPLIVVNALDAMSARIFTLLHELVHLLIDEGGISNLRLRDRPRTEDDRIEVFCNAVAAETLVPRSDLREDVDSALLAKDLDASIASLSEIYQVSREVIARRLLELRFITREAYEAKRQEYAKKVAERVGPAGGEPRVPYPRRVLGECGRALARVVLTAHAEGLITARDVSVLLNARLKHLPKIEAELARATATRTRG